MAYSNNPATFNITNSGLTNFEIGGTQASSNLSMIGNIAEVIYYNRGISTQELAQTQSYLSIKYGIPLNPTAIPNYLASNGSVIWSGVSNTAYSNTIIGIGRDDNSGLLQYQSASSLGNDILTLGVGSITTSNAANNAANPGMFGVDKSFLLVGNNAITSSVTNTSDLPTNPGTSLPMRTRMGRVWIAQVTGTISSASLQFNLAGAFSSTVPYATTDLCLLINRGNTGGFTSSISGTGVYQTATQIGGSTSTVYQFSGITLNSGDRFTIGLVKKAQSLAFAQQNYPMIIGQSSTISATLGSLTSAATVTYRVEAGSGSATVNASSGLVTASGAGTLTLIASTTATVDYISATTSTLITIGAGTPVLTLPVIGANSLTVDRNLIITASSNPPTSTTQQLLSYSVSSSVGGGSATVNANTGQLTGTRSGAITFTATAFANTNYNQAVTSTLIVIGKSTPTLSLSVTTAMTVGLTQTAITSTTALVSSGGVVSYAITGSGSATINPANGLITALGFGTITLTATSAGDTDYNPAVTSRLITISKGIPTLSLTSTSMNLAVNTSATVTAVSLPPGAGTISSTGGISYSILSTSGGGSATINVNTGFVVAVNSGSVTIQALQASDANYNAVSTTLVINIGVGVQTVSFSSASYTLLTNQTQTITATNSVSTGGGTITYSITAGSGSATVNVTSGQVLATGAGTVTLTAQAASNSNYAQASTSTLITINPSTPTLSLSPTLAANALKVDQGTTITASSSPYGYYPANYAIQCE